MKSHLQVWASQLLAEVDTKFRLTCLAMFAASTSEVDEKSESAQIVSMSDEESQIEETKVIPVKAGAVRMRNVFILATSNIIMRTSAIYKYHAFKVHNYIEMFIPVYVNIPEPSRPMLRFLLNLLAHRLPVIIDKIVSLKQNIRK